MTPDAMAVARDYTGMARLIDIGDKCRCQFGLSGYLTVNIVCDIHKAIAAALRERELAVRREIAQEWNDHLCGGLASSLSPEFLIAMHDRRVYEECAKVADAHDESQGGTVDGYDTGFMWRSASARTIATAIRRAGGLATPPPRAGREGATP